ncbi:dormancy-associated translation inhibitor [Plantactinospora mayteni]|uniref:Dormancy associated translation inhibitor n=1 Tax=Plantactinospora mayteni TaxID=566021 RepID=A0ABQ4F1Z7_9ACTN|nr:sigma 54 modulation/S30EA ribosomal C-terminal domain-containing protein [Plantactinospora mayteni]GIH00943.1 dormancy associated translation inhibitor [Plantactinospora mayteni]
MLAPDADISLSSASAGGLVQVHTRGLVGADERDCAQAMIGAVLAHHKVPAAGARVRLSGGNCPGGPILVQVNLRVCGAPARMQVPGRPVATAIAAGAARLERQIRRLTTAWQPWPWPDPERRALSVPGHGQIARLKTYRLHSGVPCQAAAFLNAMDYDVHLFTDAETSEDAVIYRAGPTGLRLARQRSMRPPSMPVTLPLTVNPRKTPILTPAQAADRLAEGWLPFVFYTDRDSGRGNLLYRRYDGNLGLISPTITGTDPPSWIGRTNLSMAPGPPGSPAAVAPRRAH